MSVSSKAYLTKLQLLDRSIVVVSVLACCLLLMVRFPGTSLLGIGPNWLLIWMVVWSLKRSTYEILVAGITLGLIQDGMSSPYPSHIFSLVVVGILTAKIDKHKYFRQDFISIALVVFAMAIVAETILAIQYGFQGLRPWSGIWMQYQRTAVSSAIISSLWTPIAYIPLNWWWKKIRQLEEY
jgi:rod shape-determining protein MreD